MSVSLYPATKPCVRSQNPAILRYLEYYLLLLWFRFGRSVPEWVSSRPRIDERNRSPTLSLALLSLSYFFYIFSSTRRFLARLHGFYLIVMIQNASRLFLSVSPEPGTQYSYPSVPGIGRFLPDLLFRRHRKISSIYLLPSVYFRKGKPPWTFPLCRATLRYFRQVNLFWPPGDHNRIVRLASSN